MNRPKALIDARAIARNLQQIQRLLSNPSIGDLAPPRVWAVVKADAYGHGLSRVMPGLSAAHGLAVQSVDEAHACRTLGWRKPILVLGGVSDAHTLDEPVLHPLHVVVNHRGQLEALARGRPARPVFAWLRMRGRLNHAGFDTQDYPGAHARLQALQRSGHIRGAGHLCHYAQAEDAIHWQAEHDHFVRSIVGLPGPVCADNSASVLMQPAQAARADWVRTGIALYGISPLADRSAAALGLQAAMVLQAPLLDTVPLRAGEALGYGGDFRARHDTRIGLVGCGYAHGYPRQPGVGAVTWFNGRRCAIVGRVSMEMLAIDLGIGTPPPSPSAPVVLWGHPELAIEEVARIAGTIPAQLCTALTAQVARV